MWPDLDFWGFFKVLTGLSPTESPSLGLILKQRPMLLHPETSTKSYVKNGTGIPET